MKYFVNKKLIYKQLKKYNYTKKDFCKTYDISIKTFNNFVNCKTTPRLNTVYKIAKGLSTSLDLLIRVKK